ncbi:beta-1,4-galactosyltransferase 4-like [Ciona intestinalis]
MSSLMRLKNAWIFVALILMFFLSFHLSDVLIENAEKDLEELIEDDTSPKALLTTTTTKIPTTTTLKGAKTPPKVTTKTTTTTTKKPKTTTVKGAKTPPKVTTKTTTTKKPEVVDPNACPLVSPLTKGDIKIDLLPSNKKDKWPPSEDELIKLMPQLSNNVGNIYKGPPKCNCRSKTAVIVPYRARTEHLKFFLFYTHQMLQRQQLCYVIFVVTQDDRETFNKGKLMNAGFVEAKKYGEFDCFIFHDVDLIAMNDKISYTCKDEQVVHYSFAMKQFDFKPLYLGYVGGALGFTKNQFETVNGFSNQYVGRGGEDDDMQRRIRFRQIKVWEPKESFVKYANIPHGKDIGYPQNKLATKLMEKATTRMDTDGLKSLSVKKVTMAKHKTYVEFLVKL